MTLSSYDSSPVSRFLALTCPCSQRSTTAPRRLFGFIHSQTEQDLAEMAGAGLNWIRLPIPFWAIETWPGEPFLAQVCWK